ncbi:MAG: sigma 54-interacting transcriptional regulator [Byssovorax sp.]
MPSPAGAVTSAALALGSSNASAQSTRSASRSRSRPTQGVLRPSSVRAGSRVSRSARRACSPSGPIATSKRASRRPIVTGSRSAAPSPDAARSRSCTARSMASPEGNPASASPRPEATATAAPGSAARTRSAARAARAASSRAVGAPRSATISVPSADQRASAPSGSSAAASLRRASISSPERVGAAWPGSAGAPAEERVCSRVRPRTTLTKRCSRLVRCGASPAPPAASSRSAQRVRHGQGALRTLLAILRKHALEEIREGPRHARDEGLDRRRIPRDQLADHRRHMVAGEDHCAAQRLVEHAAEGEEVGALVEIVLPLGLLRGHVAGRSDRGARRGERSRAAQAGDAEIEDPRVGRIAACEQEVLGFDVPVEDAARVGPGERVGDGDAEAHRLVDRERAAAEARREVFPVEPLHGKKWLAVRGRPVGEVAHDPRVIEPGEQARLAREALLLRGAVHHLERDPVARHEVGARVDRPHPARPGGPLDLEAIGDPIPGAHAAIVPESTGSAPLLRAFIHGDDGRAVSRPPERSPPRAPAKRSATTRPVAAAALAPPPGAQGWSLLVVEHTSSRLVPLPREGELVIGRGEDCHLRLDDPSISRRHARLSLDPREIRVTDLGSRNGVRVGNAPLSGERAVTAGDVITLGEVTLIVRGPPSGGAARVMPQSPSAEAEGVILTFGDRTIALADPAMIRLYALIERLAAAELPVLLVGETGAGKEHAAFAVHHGSARRDGPFVSVNCAAIPESLVESELFGHEKGAFSGAHAPRPGLFERAEGGTLFLDEVGELGLAAQAKLLRVLEGGHFARVGDTRERRADVRIVAATNRDLPAEVKARRFREDLLYRLNSAVVLIPPLRERPADIPVLARRFLTAARERARKPPLVLDDDALVALLAHPFPGNVRELRNAMDYAAAATTGEVLSRASLPASLAGEQGAATSFNDTSTPGVPRAPLGPIAEELTALERRRMVEALAATGGVKTHAARLISMPERTFRLKLRQYGIEPGVEPGPAKSPIKKPR